MTGTSPRPRRSTRVATAGASLVSRIWLAGCLALCVAAGAWAQGLEPVAPPAAPVDHATRLAEVRDEIKRLERELQRMVSRERGLLGEIEKLGTESALRRAESEEAGLQLASIEAEIDSTDSALDEIDSAQSDRRRYLAFRLREIYKDGPGRVMQRLVGGERGDRYWRGLQYAAYLSQRDRDVLDSFVADQARSLEHRDRLGLAHDQLSGAQQSAQAAEDELAASSRRQQAALRRLRSDRTQRRRALEELRGAATELENTVARVARGEVEAAPDVRRFRGLLEWPADGPVANGFGTVVHPQFGTDVPHPGLDLDAGYGASIRSAFDGTVVYADWMRGYGLTAIVDHGSGLMSIYAHASALLTEAGDRVDAGQVIGSVGDTGSLRGPHLYFEIRVDGQPVDPRGWLRPR